jgi:hypothetical protein
MNTILSSTTRFVICLNNADYQASLELHKIYRVIPDDALEADDIRIVDESGEDYIYPAACFAPIELPAEIEKAFLCAT